MSLVVLLSVVTGVLGLAVGSFLNVVIYRVPRGESVVSPPSHCPKCAVRIKARHNVPLLGWFVLRGRCADCGLPISGRYPLVESATATLFVAFTLRFGVTTTLPASLYLAAIVVTVAMIDIDLRVAPRAIVGPSIVVSGALLAASAVVGGDGWRFVSSVAGSVTLAAATLAGSIASSGAASSRDLDAVAVAALLGLYLGHLSWKAILLGVLAIAVFTTVNTATERRVPALDPPGGSPIAVAVRRHTRAPSIALLCLFAVVVLMTS